MVPSLVEIPLVNKESIADPANGRQCFLSFIVTIDSMGKPISGYGRTIDQKGKKKVKKSSINDATPWCFRFHWYQSPVVQKRW